MYFYSGDQNQAFVCRWSVAAKKGRGRLRLFLRLCRESNKGGGRELALAKYYSALRIWAWLSTAEAQRRRKERRLGCFLPYARKEEEEKEGGARRRRGGGGGGDGREREREDFWFRYFSLTHGLFPYFPPPSIHHPLAHRMTQEEEDKTILGLFIKFSFPLSLNGETAKFRPPPYST